jgi:hypothetical protein
MCYLFELQMGAGIPGYVIADGESREEALARLQERLSAEVEEEVVVLAVHTVH